jgi:hypothetical protein
VSSRHGPTQCKHAHLSYLSSSSHYLSPTPFCSPHSPPPGIAFTFFCAGMDKPRAGELINVLKEANQPVPEELLKFGTAVKKKARELEGRRSGRGRKGCGEGEGPNWRSEEVDWIDLRVI